MRQCDVVVAVLAVCYCYCYCYYYYDGYNLVLGSGGYLLTFGSGLPLAVAAADCFLTASASITALT